VAFGLGLDLEEPRGFQAPGSSLMNLRATEAYAIENSLPQQVRTTFYARMVTAYENPTGWRD
jgi:hypothetical protein